MFWVDVNRGINTEINHIIVCSKKKSQSVSNDMKDVILAIAYVIDESVKTDAVLDFKKCEYIAVGNASAKGRWNLFG